MFSGISPAIRGIVVDDPVNVVAQENPLANVAENESSKVVPPHNITSHEKPKVNVAKNESSVLVAPLFPELYPSIRNDLVKKNRILPREYVLERVKQFNDEKSSSYVEFNEGSDPWGVDLGDITFSEFRELAKFLLPHEVKRVEAKKAAEKKHKKYHSIEKLQYLRVNVTDISGYKLQSELKGIVQAFQQNHSILFVSGLDYTQELATYDEGIKGTNLTFIQVFGKIRGFAERNRIDSLYSQNVMLRNHHYIDYESVWSFNPPTPHPFRSLEVQNYGSVDPRLEQNMLFFAKTASFQRVFSNLFSLSINGRIFEESRIPLELLDATKDSLRALYLTEMGIDDTDCVQLMQKVRLMPKLQILDLSDNSIHGGSPFLSDYILETENLEKLVLSRNPILHNFEELLQKARRNNLINSRLEIRLDPLNHYTDWKALDSLFPTVLPENAVPVYAMKPKEYMQRRFGEEKWAQLWNLTRPEIKEFEAKKIGTAFEENPDLAKIRDIQEEVQMMFDAVSERMGELIDEEKFARELLEKAMKQAEAMVKKMEKLSTDFSTILQEIHDSNVGLSKEEKTALSELKEFRAKLKSLEAKAVTRDEIEELKDRIDTIEENLSSLGAEVAELTEMQRIYEERGRFLLADPRFQLAYGVVIEKLKNEMMGRAALASGVFKKEAFQDVEAYQGFVQKFLQGPLSVVNMSGTTGISAVSNLLGTACGIVSVSTSGLTFGASLALEIIPIALGLFTPVITSTIDFGCCVVGKLQDQMVDKAFDQWNERKAKKMIIAVAQAGSLSAQDQLNMDIAFGFAYHMQSQLKMLTEKDVKKFAEAWAEGFVSFTHKNRTILEGLLTSSGEKGVSPLSSQVVDISWEDIPNRKLQTIYQGSHNFRTWDWLPNELKSGLEKEQKIHSTTRELLRQTGVRWKENNRWVHWSQDPEVLKNRSPFEHLLQIHGTTRAWAFGYRSFPTSESAKRFIDAQQNHYLGYGGEMIDLVTKAIFTLKSNVSKIFDKKFMLEPGTQHVLSVEALDARHQQTGQAGKLAMAVSPSVQRFQFTKGLNEGISTPIGSLIVQNVADQEAIELKETISTLELLLRPVDGQTLFIEQFDRSFDNFSLQLDDLLKKNKKSHWSHIARFVKENRKKINKPQKGVVPAVIQRVMEEVRQVRGDWQALAKSLESLNSQVEHKSRSPLIELMGVMKRDSTRERGCLLIPLTVKNIYDWQILKIDIVKKGEKKFAFSIQVKIVGEKQEYENDVKGILEEIKTTIASHFPSLLEGEVKINEVTVHASLSDTLRSEIGQKIPENCFSKGIFVAEYIRNLALYDSTVRKYGDINELLQVYHWHQNLAKRLYKVGSEELNDEEVQKLDALLASKKDNPWSEDPFPLGPPDLYSEEHVSAKANFLGKIRRKKEVDNSRLEESLQEMQREIRKIRASTPNTHTLIEDNKELRDRMKEITDRMEKLAESFYKRAEEEKKSK